MQFGVEPRPAPQSEIDAMNDDVTGESYFDGLAEYDTTPPPGGPEPDVARKRDDGGRTSP
jgi:hypothetical protein